MVVAGCRSAAEQDLVTRELRRQEDQVYAMEDYLAQYQQLVCKYRAENAALRRQLGDSRPATVAEPVPPGVRSRGAIAPGPANQPAEPPNVALPQDDVPAAGDADDAIEIEQPDVPPLQPTSSQPPPSALIAAAYEEPAANAASTVSKAIVEEAPAEETTSQSLQVGPSGPQQIAIRGEVVANGPNGGPRLAVRIQPLDGSHNFAEFEGSASLMLLAPQEEASQQNLARWDFEPEEVHSAVDLASGEPAMRFYLELPATAPTSQVTELWVRLLPRVGAKMLAHADLDLARPGQFASKPVASHGDASNDYVGTPDAVEAVATAEGHTANVFQSDWTVAQPGKPANVPDARQDTVAAWRASSEVIPTTVYATAVPVPQVVRQAAHLEDTRPSPPPAYKRPTWAPDRAGISTANSGHATGPSQARRPAWSAKRQ